ncbi:NAD(P)-binding protein [Pluteus cervinus]|uniref:NAD(P)-binding protein n=1 Tax=Pluteus cervinus TaxID=181527 RepID=A0ACD3BAT8_9AGAR|nr:NAD(P)-binding protein [Pluteus cervinus]
MAATSPFVLRWGIISTGGIATKFVTDLLVDPKSRDAPDVVHKITAVGSRSVEKAQEFIDTVAGGDKSIKPYGSYHDVYADKDVDAIYIGTPHTFHYVNALDAIKAGKSVLCEKPVTTNLPELRALHTAAKEHNVFFMEAMWTRFQPLSLEIKRIIDQGALGDPVVLHADLSGNFDIHNLPLTHRILDPALGGGALLDLGPYPLIWAILALYEHPKNNSTKPQISSSMLKTPLTGVDSNTSFTLNFTSSSLSAQAILTCSINLNAPNPGVIIRCTRGTIIIEPPIYCPKVYILQYHDDSGKIVREEKRVFEYVGGGWHFPADEVARCVRDGKKESEVWGWDKILLEMEIFDTIRKQNDFNLPPGVEKVL